MIDILAQNLQKWYWKNGYKRKGEALIAGNWISKLYSINHTMESLKNISSRQTVAIWGPSQSGKSTFMSKIINSEDETKSALMWDDNLFLFDIKPENKAKKKDVKVLNPHTGGDASACASRFYLIDKIEDVQHPIRIIMADRIDFLHALVEGYLDQVSLKDTNGIEDVWTKEKLEQLLKKIPDNSVGHLDRNASELLFDFVHLLDRMINANNRYVVRLKENDDWNSFLKERILSDKLLRTDYKKTKEFIQEFLWRDENSLNEKFEKLLLSQNKFKKIIGNKKLKCSLEFASYLLDMSMYTKEKEDIVNNIIKKTSFIDDIQSNSIIITQKNIINEKRITFDNIEDFYNFQLLVWELAIPLNKDQVKENLPNAIEPLQIFDILDLPGISNDDSSGSNNDNNLSNDDNNSPFIKFGKLFKRGKSATFIYKYAESMSISALLLTISTVPLDVKLRNQVVPIKNGIDAIWSGLDFNYTLKNKNRESVPVPISINFSFFAQVVESFITLENLNTYEEDFNLGVFSQPNYVYSFATNYYWYFNKGHQKMVEVHYNNKDDYLKLLQNIPKENWIKKRFLSSLEKESVKELLKSKFSGDGGISYLLNAQKEILSKFNFYSIQENRKLQLEKELEGLLDDVSPLKDDNGEKVKLAISNLFDYLDTKLSNIKEDVENKKNENSLEKNILSLSKNLRILLSCEFDELNDICRLNNLKDQLEDYYIEEVLKWKQNIRRKNILATFGLSTSEQTIILRLLSSRFLSTENFYKKYKEIWEAWSENPTFPTSGEGETYRRIIAKQMSNDLYHKKVKSSQDKNIGKIIEHCEKIYKNNNIGKIYLLQIHLDNTIPTLIEHLRDIFKNCEVVKNEEIIDNEIIALHEQYYTNKGVN